MYKYICKCFFILELITLLMTNSVWADSRTLKASIQKDYQLVPGMVGLDILVSNNTYPVVKKVLVGLPAYEAGLLEGDKIIQLNTISTLGKDMHEVDQLISDIPGDKVTFKIKRGSKIFARTITVQPIEGATYKVVQYYVRPISDY